MEQLDRYWRESKRKEERLRERQEQGAPVPRQQIPQPQVWPRRQEMPQQQIQAGSAPIERVERINAEMACPQQRVRFTQRNSYAMDVDRRKRRNCYNYRGFGHIARNCRNRGVGSRIREERRLEYGELREKLDKVI